MLSLLTINVQAAGLARAARLFDWIQDRDDHAIVLTETSNGPGTAHLLARCRAAGLATVHEPAPGGDRGVAIVTRIPATHQMELTAATSLPHRAVAVTLDIRPPITLIGVYAPSSDRAPTKIAKERTFLGSTLQALDRIPPPDRASLVVAGDFNVIARSHRPRYPAFQAFEYDFLDHLAALGLTDIHDHLHPGEQPYSWYGRRGNGYRFDYMFTGSALTPSATGCTYLQQPRTSGLTDHAAVSLVLGGLAHPARPADAGPVAAATSTSAVAARIRES